MIHAELQKVMLGIKCEFIQTMELMNLYHPCNIF